MTTKKLKEITTHHILKNGQKKTTENIFMKSFKLMQKNYKKNHNEITKLAIINATSTFRIIKLKNNRQRKKKSTKEVPAFFSAYNFRTSWALKYLTATKNQSTFQKSYDKIKQEIIYNSKNQGTAVKQKNELYNQILKNKKYFKYYRW